jgi:predicted phage terminase large subunit-like protein
MYPAGTWINQPELRYLSITNEQGLSIRDALRMKQIITSDWFQSKWPLPLRSDQNEKTLYANDKNGFRQSQGITASNTGKRGDVILIDDPIDAKHAFSDVIRQGVNDTWDQSLSSRLNHLEESGVLLIMQRLHEDDLSGHLLKKVKSKWTHLVIPMRYEGHPTFDAGKDIGRPDLNDPRTEKGELLFGKRFSERAVQALEEDLGEYGAAGQLQQRPVPAGGGIIKKHWWRVWGDDQKLPVCDHIFHSWDTAFSEKDQQNAAYSACTRWGIFWHEQRERYCILALGMWFERLGYDELRAKLKELDKKYNPDANLIEKKATGISLIQDLKRASPGRVRAYSPGKGEDKVSRAHSVSPMLQAGLVYVPNKAWALGDGQKRLGLIDYVAQFPNGGPPSPDLTDTCTQALIYLRAGNWTGDHPDDKEDVVEHHLSEEQEEDLQPERRSYYG